MKFPKINWKKWLILIGIGVLTPFAVIGMWIIDSISYDIDILNDVYYIYLVQANILLWVILYFILGIYYKKEER